MCRKVNGVLCLGLLVSLAPSIAAAEPPGPMQISIRYSATLAGLYIGSAQLQIALTRTAYNIAATGSLGGILKNLVGFRLNVNSYGILSNNQMIPQRYTTEYGIRDRLRSIKIKYSRGRKAVVSATPPFFPSPSRVALKPAHLRNTLDPLSALFMPVKKNLVALSPDNCQRLTAVFDGRMRYNLKISSIGETKLPLKIRGFKGPLLVCRIKMQPIAGYSKQKQKRQKAGKKGEMVIWLTPAGPTGLLIPVKGRLPTPYGMAEISIRRLYLNGQKVAAL